MGSDLEAKDEELREVQNMQDDNECNDVGSSIPVVGMSFNTDMDAYYFYNRYAKNVGFSVRKKTMYSNAKGKVKRRDLCCSWEGCYQMKAPPKKKREEKRCGCKAMLIVKLDENEKYVVTSFVEEHNHPLENPKNAHKLRSHRQIEPSQMGSESELSKEDDDAKDEYVNTSSPIPVVGMLFNTDMDAYYFYNRYAKKIGFSVRKKTMYCNGNGKVKRRDLCCSLEGSYRNKLTPQKKREEKRCGCEALLIVRLNENEKYVVTNFVEEHNHHLENPANANKLRSHRQAEPFEVGVLQNMDAMTNLLYSYRGKINRSDASSSYSKRYNELSHWAQTLVAKGASTDEKFALAMSEMLHTISKLDSLPDSEEHVRTVHDNNSVNYEVPIDQSIADQSGADLLLRDRRRKKRPGQPKIRTKKVLEKGPKRWKDISSKQAESVIEAIQEKYQDLEEAPNTSALSTLSSCTYIPHSNCLYPMIQGFPCNQPIPTGKPSAPFDQPLNHLEVLARPMEYTTEQYAISTQCSQARVESSHEI